jgi:FkbM family methyltransferase
LAVGRRVRGLLNRIRGGSDRSKSAAEQLYARFISAGDLVFDVGANMGERTKTFLELGADVIAIEPQDVCVTRLRERFGDSITTVPAAVGRTEGEADLLVASYHTISSLSPAWVESVRASGRFAEFTWNETVRVPVTTLDTLIGRYGVPAFCKIDVEGYELAVMEGLSRPLLALSFEFDPELLDERTACVRRLVSLGMSRFNFSEGESMRLTWPGWVTAETLVAFLRSAPRDGTFFGDVYAAL